MYDTVTLEKPMIIKKFKRKALKLKNKATEELEFIIFISFFGLIFVLGKSLGLLFSHDELRELEDSFEPDYDFINRSIR